MDAIILVPDFFCRSSDDNTTHSTNYCRVQNQCADDRTLNVKKNTQWLFAEQSLHTYFRLTTFFWKTQ